MTTTNHGAYFIPEPSKWPIVATIALLTTAIGAATSIHGDSPNIILGAGLLLIIFLLYGWFSSVIDESMRGSYNEQVDRSFRLGMMWFIFSEVMFFAAFFGALFYARIFAVPWLGGSGNNAMTHELLWPAFESIWPVLTNPDNSIFTAPKEAMAPSGLPAINTAILLASSVTVTWAHHALRSNNRSQLILGLTITVILGITFLFFQAEEYIEAYREMGLTLASGIYGSTFFMLTGFHGFHVTMGATMLTVILVRSIKGHFTPDNHFGFEAVAWYWHFVDVVWLGLFIFVYWL
ncbi:MAG: cytochrome c oxidase subunit 3 [Gammaproteobacteria bacterium]|nr:cytochrome c oxidase subunit 3 [Gammaproteobacteria bacterium]